MFVALAIIAFALLVVGGLFFFFWSASLTRTSGKRKYDETIKPKRDDRDRLILDEDGELIDFPIADDEDTYAQRS